MLRPLLHLFGLGVGITLLIFIGLNQAHLPALAAQKVPPTLTGGRTRDSAVRLDSTPVATIYLYLPLVVSQPPPPSSKDFAREVVERTNFYRSQKPDCSPLQLNDKLSQAARRHSRDMALNDFVGHQGSDGSWPEDRAEAAGYNKWSRLAENVAAGQSTPEEVVDDWMNSPDHRQNILNCRLKDVGVNYYYLADDPGRVRNHHYWTQVFGTHQE